MSRIKTSLKALFLAAGLSLAAVPVSAGVFDAIPGKPAAKPKPETLTVNSRKRAYFLFAPSSVTEPAPVVIVLHGGGGEAERIRTVGFDDLAKSEGFIAVYPQSAEGQWNDGRAFTDRFAETATVDDVGFIRELIAKLVADGLADRKRVYVTGVSSGGMMAFRLACEIGDQLAGIAPVIALMPKGLPERCVTRQPLPLLLMIGTEDQIVPVKGGPVAGFFANRRDGDDRGAVESLATTLQVWGRRNQCHGKAPQRRWLPDRDAFDSTRVQVTTWPQCAAGTQLYSIVGGGHQWPGRPVKPGAAFTDRFVGRGTTEINAAPVIWSFFRSLAEAP